MVNKMKNENIDINIRKENKQDYSKVEEMVRRSFYNQYRPGCDEHLMVHTMRNHPAFLPEYSRIATVDGKVAGLINYFMSKIVVGDKEISVPSFGPLCVDHKYKNKGIGGKLIHETLALVKEAGEPGVIIFGEPEYYPKHGFLRAGELGLTDANGNVFDAFMAIELIPGALSIPGGKFVEPEDLCSFSDEAVEEFDKKFNRRLPLIHKAIRPCQWTYENPTDEKNGYHMMYALHAPRDFEEVYRRYAIEWADVDQDINPDDYMEMIEEILSDVNKTAYVIYACDKAVGLFVCSVPSFETGAHDAESIIEAIYILPEFRGRGIARDVISRFIKQQKANVGFYMFENSRAKTYFEKVLDEQGVRYDIYRAYDDVNFYLVIV